MPEQPQQQQHQQPQDQQQQQQQQLPAASATVAQQSDQAQAAKGTGVRKKKAQAQLSMDKFMIPVRNRLPSLARLTAIWPDCDVGMCDDFIRERLSQKARRLNGFEWLHSLWLEWSMHSPWLESECDIGWLDARWLECDVLCFYLPELP
eukprot:g74017.t1